MFASLSISTTAYGSGRKPAVSRPDPEIVKSARRSFDQGKPIDAVSKLNKAIDQESSTERKALLRLALAVLLDDASKPTEAEVQYTQAIDQGLRVPEYAYMGRGLIRKKAGKLKEARADFEKVVASKAPLATEIDARLELGEIAMEEKNWKLAQGEFVKLRKKTRSHTRYPDVLYHLYRAEKHLGTRGGGCAWARELYSKYPTHALVKSWGSELAKAQVDGVATNCQATASDLKTRVRRLQLGGEAERAAKELKEHQQSSGDDYSIDSMLANHLISEGQVDDAVKLLLKHYEAQKSRAQYLQLLAKAAARGGDYASAIALYGRAFELNPKARDSANPLFQAAFTSYQIQDYDGATRRFEQLVKAFPSSKLARDARWHLAWIRYLRGDYEGALDRFNAIAREPRVIKKRGRRGKRVVVVINDAVSNERLKYWSAMSLLKLGRTQEAIPIFQNLVRDPGIGYYSVLSFYRLLSTPGAKFPPGIETRLGLKKTDGSSGALSEEELRAAAEAAEEAEEEFEVVEAITGAGGGVEVAEGPVAAAEAEAAQGAEVSATQASAEEAGEFKDASLALRFERARDLAFAGLMQASRRELAEIEKRARRVDDRKLLMAEYAQVENYYRSSYIGDLGFSSVRMRGGLRGESRTYWEYAYPRAWPEAVQGSMRATMVPEEFIYGIMRAESHYRSDAQSPVGALGLMQIMPYTGRQVASLMSIGTFETKSLLEPEVNIRLGSRYLQRLLEKFSGSIPLVAASYNAGPHRVHAWVRNFGSLDMDEFIEHIPFIETRNYVKRVVRNYQIYSLLYSGGTHSLRWLVQPVGVEVDERVPTKEVW